MDGNVEYVLYVQSEMSMIFPIAQSALSTSNRRINPPGRSSLEGLLLHMRQSFQTSSSSRSEPGNQSTREYQLQRLVGIASPKTPNPKKAVRKDKHQRATPEHRFWPRITLRITWHMADDLAHWSSQEGVCVNRLFMYLYDLIVRSFRTSRNLLY